MDAPIYDSDFYDRQYQRAYDSALMILRHISELACAKSIVDVGCGKGAWLSAAEELGIIDQCGIDGSWCAEFWNVDRAGEFHVADLSQTLVPHRRFDLCISMEVAEHLPQERSQAFVAELCEFSDAVLFGAAIPNQGGTNHINERLHADWLSYFENEGYECFDPVRQNFWDMSKVGWWYRQNAYLYLKVESDIWSRLSGVLPEPLLVDALHPEGFGPKLDHLQGHLTRYERIVREPTLKDVLRAAYRWVRKVLTRR